jgi:hypothetical protein
MPQSRSIAAQLLKKTYRGQHIGLLAPLVMPARASTSACGNWARRGYATAHRRGLFAPLPTSASTASGAHGRGCRWSDLLVTQ